MDVRENIAVFISAVLYAGIVFGGAAPQVLLVTVLQTDDVELTRALLSSEPGTDTVESGNYLSSRTYGTNDARLPSGYRQLQVIEGQGAYFSTGYRTPEVRFLWAESTPAGLLPNVGLGMQESVSGFYVKAKLNGDRVVLQLDQTTGESRPGYSGPGYSGHGLRQNIHTTVSGHLDDWMDAGGSLALDGVNSVMGDYVLQGNSADQIRFLIKVERVSR